MENFKEKGTSGYLFKSTPYIKSKDVNGNIIYIDPVTGKTVRTEERNGTTYQASAKIKKDQRIREDVRKKHNLRINSGQSIMVGGREVRIGSPKLHYISLSTDNRPLYMKDASKQSYELEYKQLQLDEAEKKTLGALGAFSSYLFPSTYLGALTDLLEGKKSFLGSLVEGNEGLGNPVANLAADIITPYGISKGLNLLANAGKTFGKVGNKALNFLNSPYTGKWTQFGNREYRFKPGYLGMNGTPVESRAAQVPFKIETYPGYQLKGLMRGNPLEKQLSKTGTISVNNIKAQAAKGSNVEKAVIDEVLGSEQFAGQKAIDYNAFRKAVQNRLITYERVPSTKFEEYGLNRLGIDKYTLPEHKSMSDLINIYKKNPMFSAKWSPAKYGNRTYYFDLENVLTGPKDEYTVGKWIQDNLADKLLELNTFTFESPRIPSGNAKHYNPATLGHSRTYTTVDEPNVLHVMESQSDWGQSKIKMLPSVRALQLGIEKAILSGNTNAFHEFTNRLHSMMRYNLNKAERMALDNITKEIKSGKPSGFSTIDELWNKKYKILTNVSKRSNIGILGLYLHDNYLQRQLQENLKYAAEHNQTKMRYPTPETAAKIEGYQKEAWAVDEAGNKINPYEFFNFKRSTENPDAPLETFYDFPEGRGGFGYKPEHQTILKKYSDFPKMYSKLYKGAEVRTVTDAKGNTWYEVDVPEDYLNQEWIYKFGGKLNLLNYKQGGKLHKYQWGNKILNYINNGFDKPRELYNLKLNSSHVDINALINYRDNYDKLFLDPELLKGVDDYMISKNIGLPQRLAILYSIWQEGSRIGSHGNGAYGLVGWRGQRAKNLSDTVQGLSEKLYNELFGKFNADNWNDGGKGSGYKSGRIALQSFINAKTFSDAIKALNYGYIRPPRQSLVKRLNSKIFL